MMPGANVLYSNRFDDDRDVPWHEHAGVELVYVREGACRIDAAGIEMEAESGDLFVLPARVPHCQWSHGLVRTTYVVFVTGKAVFDDSARVIDAVPAVARWMEDLVDLYAKEQLDIGALLLEPLLETIRQQDRHRTISRRRHPAVEAAMAFIQANVSAPLSVDAVAEQAAVSASHLSALFRHETGGAVMEYIHGLRLTRARRLLVDPQLSVAQVAAMCGFDDVNYFVRYFRKRVGKPPGVWRRSHNAADL